MPGFSEKVVLIRGAGKGLGRELAIAFSKKGAVIAASDASPLHLERTDQLIRGQSGICRTYDHDMTKKHFVQGTIEDIQDELGSLDFLMNVHFLDPKNSLEEIDAWDWQHSLDVNLTGTLYTVQAFLRVAENTPSRKHIITVIPDAVHPALEIMKCGLLGMTAAGAMEGADRGVCVNAISARDFSGDALIKKVFEVCADRDHPITAHLLTSQESIPLQDFPV